MQNFVGFLGLAAIGFFLWSIWGVVFAKGRRIRKLKLSGAGLFVMICTAVISGQYNNAARDAGFNDAADQIAAQNAGIADPAVWQARKIEAKQLAADQAAREHAEAEKQAKALAEEKAQKDAEELAAQERTKQLAAEQAKVAAEEKAKKDAEELVAQEKAKQEKEIAAKAKAEQCRQDIQCWAEEAFVAASSACTVAVQSLAKWDYEWTDGWTEPKFARYRWKNKDKGIVTYMGDKLKLQNGFGAWKRVSYSCDYDPGLKAVLSAQAL